MRNWESIGENWEFRFKSFICPFGFRYYFRCEEGRNLINKREEREIYYIEIDATRLKETFTSFPTKAVGMLTSRKISDSWQRPHDLKEIGALSINGECIIEIEATVANLKKSGAIM